MKKQRLDRTKQANSKCTHTHTCTHIHTHAHTHTLKFQFGSLRSAYNESVYKDQFAIIIPRLEMPLFRKGIKGFMLAKSVVHISHVNHLTKEKVIFSFSYMEGMIFLWLVISCEAFPGGSDSKESACNGGDPGSIPGSRISPGEGNGYPLQYSCLENSTVRESWWATVHGVARSRT